MSELQSLKRRFKQCFKEGFWLDNNTFLKSEDVEIRMAKMKEDNGKLAERPMIILKHAVVMTVNRSGKIVSVETKPAFGVWARTAEKALKQLDRNAKSLE
jgi:hypothetical protein